MNEVGASMLRFIVVEGPIGVGKTTLARRLAATYGTQLLLEGADENPFLSRFYNNPREAALPTQLFFLFQRSRQLQGLRQGDMFKPVRVSDFLMGKDRLFAELTLDDNELSLYQLTLDMPRPDLVVYLQAPVDVLLDRVEKRGSSYEQGITADYLQRVSDAYAEFFYYYQDSPLLIVNAADINLAEGNADYVWEALNLLKIKRIDHGNNALQDPKLIQEIIKRDMALTVCPLSNTALQVVKNLKEHPLKKMMDLGLKVTINSDDPAYFGGQVNQNYIEIQKALDLTKADLYKLAKNSFTYSLLSDDYKTKYLAELEDYYLKNKELI